jgi:hypothetical protein
MSADNIDSDSEATTTTVTTEDARQKLKQQLREALSARRNTLLDAPTSLGKTTAVATTPWREYPEVTGGRLVIHLHKTRRGRDDAATMSEQAGVETCVLRSGLDLCPVAQGDYDDELLPVEAKSASKWLKSAIRNSDYTFSEAHRMLEDRLGELPCEDGDGCPGRSSDDSPLFDDDDSPTVDVVHATHDFACRRQLVDGANVVFDERPEFNEEIGEIEASRLQRAIDDLFEQSNDGLSWVNLVQAVLQDDDERVEEYGQFLNDERQENHSRLSKTSHKHTYEVAKALVNPRSYLGEKRHVGESEGTQVVLNAQGSLRQIHYPPDLSDARCVIGLDAHPALQLWRLNTVENLSLRRLLSSSERQRWRRHRRGLRIVQVGDATRSYTLGWRSKAARAEAETLINELKRHYGSEFRTGISSKAIKGDVRRILTDAGVTDPDLMHFGNLKSRNDFVDETVGLVIGCIDPGDDRILDLLALRGLDARPKLDDKGERDYGREFVGPDADTAKEFLASVREDNLSQAVGRYARHPRSGSSEATVYVWSAALPDHLTDNHVRGVISTVTDLKEKIEEYVRDEGQVTTRKVMENCDASKGYVYDVLQELAEQGVVSVSKGTGYYNADEYHYISGSLGQSVDLGF